LEEKSRRGKEEPPLYAKTVKVISEKKEMLHTQKRNEQKEEKKEEPILGVQGALEEEKDKGNRLATIKRGAFKILSEGEKKMQTGERS